VDAPVAAGLAFLTNQMEAIDDHRGTRVVDALRSTLGFWWRQHGADFSRGSNRA
jgi:hypothetical protein